MSITEKMTQPQCIDIDQLYPKQSKENADDQKDWHQKNKRHLLHSTGAIFANGLRGFFGRHYLKLFEMNSGRYQPQLDRNFVLLIGFKSPNNPGENTPDLYDKNIERYKQLLIDLVDIKSPHLIFLSAISVYGKRWDGKNIKPEVSAGDYYSKAKLEVEMMITKFCSDNGGEFTILRVPGLIGPKCHRNFICDAFWKIKNDEVVTIKSPQNLFNNVFSVENLFRLLMQITMQPAEWEHKIVNLAGKNPLTVVECIMLLGRLLSKQVRLKVIGKTSERVIDTSTMVELGFQPDDVEVMLRESFSEQHY